MKKSEFNLLTCEDCINITEKEEQNFCKSKNRFVGIREANSCKDYENNKRIS